jgi:8-oxo-dGTP pyrophosphatase MutT (NUDIX family)
VRAAGGLLFRDGLVVLVHRPRYDDWSFPKGKLEAGEDDAAAALREVEEETGHGAEIEQDLGTVQYTVTREGRPRPKIVRYYLMRPQKRRATPVREVDRVEWLDPAQAAQRLSYERDREVLQRAVERIFPQIANFRVAGGNGDV